MYSTGTAARRRYLGICHTVWKAKLGHEGGGARRGAAAGKPPLPRCRTPEAPDRAHPPGVRPRTPSPNRSASSKTKIGPAAMILQGGSLPRSFALLPPPPLPACAAAWPPVLTVYWAWVVVCAGLIGAVGTAKLTRRAAPPASSGTISMKCSQTHLSNLGTWAPPRSAPAPVQPGTG